MAASALRLSNISKRYPGVQALNDVDFECRPGEIHAIVGENGSGKSTLLGIASGAVVSDGGGIEIMGQVLSAADPLLARRLGLATVYQDDSLVRELTVAENLYLGAAEPWVSASGKRAWAERQLAPYGLGISADDFVGALSPAERQFLEIVKALISAPKVLLLDEPTSSLDLNGVEKLAGMVRRLKASGTAVVYVSHRLPEVLALADRVTILRDGEEQGSYDVGAGLSEADLIALMVGRPIATEFPPRGDVDETDVAFWASGLSGARFRDVTFHVHRGEILGFAGAEGNGQREALRALGGLEIANGDVFCDGKPIGIGNPRQALAAGVLLLSADRSQESVFPALGVRENMTLQVLEEFAANGLVSARKEGARARQLADELGVVAASLDQAMSGLSGGNQQKTVLGRSFLYGAKVLLIDEPTQGVDAKARFDIYRAIRAKADQGTTCIINSSDALELAGLCDRVVVFSRGRIIRRLSGAAVREETIVSSFLASRAVSASDEVTAAAPPRRRPSPWARLLAARASGQWWVPLAFLLGLIVVVGAYAASQRIGFLKPVNIRHILLATAPLALVTMAQFNVLMVRGFDISVGPLMSFTVVLASFVIAFEMGPWPIVLGVALCVAAGIAAGAVNGALVRGAGVNPVITTIATWSILQGFALYGRPAPGGMISQEFLSLLTTRIGFVPVSAFLILALAIAGDVWLYRTGSGLRLRAVGFREQAAKRNGVRTTAVHVRAYLLSGLLATLAGLFLAAEVGVGAATVATSFTLTSIAAAVLGGAALSGGRGSFVGALLGALFFTLTLNVVTLLRLNTAVNVIASGALTLLAVFLYSGWEPIAWLTNRIRQAFPACAVPSS
ncbi:MAG: ATP-binding cassette domain-containing protein [Bauldia sp.]